jgi:hypothetical protein
MGAFSRSRVLILVGVVGCIALLFSIFAERRINHPSTENGAIIDIHQMSAEALSREIRNGLPRGSSLVAVEAFLNKRGIEYSYDAPSKTLHAIGRRLKDSTIIVSTSLTLTLHFEDSMTLKSITQKVTYTGP